MALPRSRHPLLIAILAEPDSVLDEFCELRGSVGQHPARIISPGGDGQACKAPCQSSVIGVVVPHARQDLVDANERAITLPGVGPRPGSRSVLPSGGNDGRQSVRGVSVVVLRCIIKKGLTAKSVTGDQISKAFAAAETSAATMPVLSESRMLSWLKRKPIRSRGWQPFVWSMFSRLGVTHESVYSHSPSWSSRAGIGAEAVARGSHLLGAGVRGLIGGSRPNLHDQLLGRNWHDNNPKRRDLWAVHGG